MQCTEMLLRMCCFQMQKGHKSLSFIMEDFCDGTAFQSSALYSVYPEALQIFLYFDEVEICNPLGSKTKTHKLGMCKFIVVTKKTVWSYLLTSVFYILLCRDVLLHFGKFVAKI